MVSFQGLLSEQETLASPAVIEGMFPLVAPGSSHQLLGPPQDTEPGVGVSVSLRREQPDITRNVPSGSSPAGGRDMRGQVIVKSKLQLYVSCVTDVTWLVTSTCMEILVPWAPICVPRFEYAP